MALRLSTGLRNALLSTRASVQQVLVGAANMALVDGGTGNDTFTDAGNGLAIFSVHDNITFKGCTTAENDKTVEILSVAAGVIGLPTGTVVTAEALLTTTRIISSRGGSVSDIFRNGVLDIYSGSQPATADAAETGTKLASITLASGAFSAGVATNGINFDVATAGVLAKDASEVWSGVGLAAGTAGWFRLYSNAYGTGLSSSYIRIDGSVATSGGQLNISNTAITVGGTTTVDTAQLTMPAA